MTTPPDNRSPLAKAYQWATRIMLVSMEMVLPGVVGFWIDQQLGTVMVFLLVGVVVGCTGAMWHLIRLTGERSDHNDRRHDGEQPRR